MSKNLTWSYEHNFLQKQYLPLKIYKMLTRLRLEEGEKAYLWLVCTRSTPQWQVLIAQSQARISASISVRMMSLGLSPSLPCVLDSLEVPLAKAVTCESNNMRAGVYRKRWGIDVLWSDITQVQEKQIHLLSEPPHVGLVTQAAGLPNLGPGNLDWGLLQALLKPKALVEARCEDAGISIS